MAKKRDTYRSILLWVFRNGSKDEQSGDVLFTQADLRRAAKTLKLEVRNFPDLAYNLRSRADLPDEIKAAGFTTIAIRGRGKYALITAADTVDVPAGTEVVSVHSAPIPEAIRDILRADEQSVLSAIRYLDIVSEFVGMKCHHLQGHLRTSGSFGQQVEADDVWVGQDEHGTRTLLPIEAKGPDEKLGRQQMMSTLDAVLNKMPGIAVIPLAAHLERDGLLTLVAFTFETADAVITSILPARFKRYRITPPLPLWPTPASGEQPPPPATAP